jgi:hypothetical protein
MFAATSVARPSSSGARRLLYCGRFAEKRNTSGAPLCKAFVASARVVHLQTPNGQQVSR